MSFLYAIALLCRSFISLAHLQKKLHHIEFGKSDVCGSLVFSNLVTYGTAQFKLCT